MYAIDFETDIKNGMVKIPDEYVELKNQHARIVVMVGDVSLTVPEEPVLDFSGLQIKAFKKRDAVEVQREMRDEW